MDIFEKINSIREKYVEDSEMSTMAAQDIEYLARALEFCLRNKKRSLVGEIPWEAGKTWQAYTETVAELLEGDDV